MPRNRDGWWIHGEPRSELRKALAGLPRYIATVETAKHRIFTFLPADVTPDNKLVSSLPFRCFLSRRAAKPHCMCLG